MASSTSSATLAQSLWTRPTVSQKSAACVCAPLHYWGQLASCLGCYRRTCTVRCGSAGCAQKKAPRRGRGCTHQLCCQQSHREMPAPVLRCLRTDSPACSRQLAVCCCDPQGRVPLLPSPQPPTRVTCWEVSAGLLCPSQWPHLWVSVGCTFVLLLVGVGW